MADNENTSVTKDLGIVSAYGYAKAAGYTGTEEDFEEIFLEFTQDAPGLLDRLDEAVEDCEDAASDAADAKTAAENAQTAAEAAAATFETDTTLSVSGKAADAKVTGDEVSELKNAVDAQSEQIEALEDVVIISDTEPTSANNKIWVNSKATQNVRVPTMADMNGVYPSESLSNKALATFSDGADGVDLKSLSFRIDATQEGENDPSPTNVRNISGVSSVNLYRTGKNLCNFNGSSASIYGVGISFSNGTATFSGTSTQTGGRTTLKTKNFPLKAGNYKLVFEITGDVPVIVFQRGTTAIKQIPPTDSSPQSISASVDSEEYNIGFNIGTINKAYTGSIKVAIVDANETDYTIVTYTEDDWNIASEDAGTLYGADITYKGDGTWQIVVDKAYAEITSFTDLYSSAGSGYTGASKAIAAMKPNSRTSGLCNYLKPAPSPSGATNNVITFGTTSNKIVYCIFPTELVGGSTLQDINTYVSSYPVKIVYPLETPVTYTASTEEVVSLLGDNAIWTDQANINLTYRADIALFVQKALNS